ncbi:MAG: Asp23/Gls24 family envelope stress response protein [Sporomusaceae bacterium]|nr:Asp23/Gls24 family envelope stress response protein [Sporomusaceae bacterium]
MKVIALVGPSGTGKSHRALIVAHEHHADTIIDDGLLIKGSKILAGHSAKREASKIQAVRRAIFMDEQHAKEVRDAIKAANCEKILILGTSKNMVKKIVHVLALPEVEQYIQIDEIATAAEMAKARESRIRDGKHIIPVPTIELKPHFSGYLIDPLEIFFRKSRSKRHKLGEKSIIRPTFSYYGKLLISDAAIASIVQQVASEQDGVTRTGQIQIKNSHDRERGLSITVDMVLQYGCSIHSVVKAAQYKMKDMVEFMTGMNVEEINVDVKRLSID